MSPSEMAKKKKKNDEIIYKHNNKKTISIFISMKTKKKFNSIL